MIISTHISLFEATYSRTGELAGIVNNPNLEELKNMRMLAMRIFEPLRDHIAEPIRINSFFRSLELNRKVGGSGTSQHCRGQAMDISSMKPSYSNADMFNYIRDNLEFDQLIWEFGNDQEPEWVHVSYAGLNRAQVLKSQIQGGKTIYINI